MSIYRYEDPSGINLRANDIKAENMWQMNNLTGEYERVLTASDSPDPIALPYYLKTNSIDIDSGSNGTELTATALTFGDSAGNSTIDKAKAGVLTDIKTSIIDSADASNVTLQQFVGYDKSTKMLTKSPVTVALMKSPAAGGSSNTCIILYRDQLKIVLQDGSNITNIFPKMVQVSNGVGKAEMNVVDSTTGGILKLSNTANSAGQIMNVDDILVTNKLKALTSATAVATSKMLIYDTTSKAFNYSDIPGGGSTTLPYYLETNKVNMVASDGLSGIILEPLNANYSCISAENLTGTRPAYTRMYPNSISFKQSAATTSYDMNHDDVRITNQLKTLASITPTDTTKTVIYNTSTNTYGYATNTARRQLKRSMLEANMYSIAVDSASVYSITGGPGYPGITFQEGDMIYCSFDNLYADKWYNIHFNSLNVTKTAFKVSIVRGNDTSGLNWNNYFNTRNYQGDKVEYRILDASLSYGGSTIPANTFYFKIGSTVQWRATDLLLIEVIAVDKTSGSVV